MRICIVGHGPSLLSQNLGKVIDRFDKVIRQKRSRELLKRPEIFGSRVDVVSVSWSLVGVIQEQFPANEYWAFLDSRYGHVTRHDIAEKRGQFSPAILRADKPLCDEWNETYRNLRTPCTLPDQVERKKSSDELGHTHLSSGFHTLLYACEFLKPKEIALAGFDNVMSGDWTWSLARGPEWQQYPDHRFDIENQMLPMISEAFNVEIRAL